MFLHALGLVLPLSVSLQAQQTIPPTATTAITPSQLPSANPPLQGTQHASVNWDGHFLQVIANNSGLNSILRAIASKSNIEISGTAPEERIFGTYGPGTLNQVIGDLLDGTKINVLFVNRPGKEKKQLILTSRAGGPTPPSPNAVRQQQEPPQSEAPPFQRTDAPDISPGGASGEHERETPPDSATPQNQTPSQDESGSDSQNASPNGVKTPQQIFEQLQRLRQQSQKP